MRAALAGVALHALPSPAEAALTGISETNLQAPVSAALLGSGFGDGVPAMSDRVHVHKAARFASGTGLLATGGDLTVDIPVYLQGGDYVLFGNDTREDPGYQAVITADGPTLFYLLLDNRVNGPAGTATKTNTTDPVLGGSLQWVLDGGWERMNTGISPNGQADYTSIDESNDGSLNQFFSVWRLPGTPSSVTVRNNGMTGTNMLSVVAVPAPPVGSVITSFSASPLTINPGTSANLNWVVDATCSAVSIDQGVGNVLPQTTGGTGTVSVSPELTTTYTLSATRGAETATETVTVTVRGIGSFTSDTPLITAGETATLSWKVRTDLEPIIQDIGSVADQTGPDGTGLLEVSPTQTTTYTLLVDVNGTLEQASVTVTVLPGSTKFALLDIGATGGRPEAGAAGDIVIGAGPDQTNTTDLVDTTVISATGVPFSIEINNLDQFDAAVGGLDWRDRGDGPDQPLVRLGEDFVKNNAGLIRVTLRGLPAGTYDAMSFHVDPANSQCDVISVYLTDASNVAELLPVTGNASFPGHPANTGAPTVGGLRTGAVGGTSAAFSFTANGSDDVIIWFDGRAQSTDTEVPFSGLYLGYTPGTPPPAADFRIVNVTRATGPASATVALEFTSTPGKTYTVKAGTTLGSWPETLTTTLNASAGTTTTFTEENIPLGTTVRFYKVEQNN